MAASDKTRRHRIEHVIGKHKVKKAECGICQGIEGAKKTVAHLLDTLAPHPTGTIEVPVAQILAMAWYLDHVYEHVEELDGMLKAIHEVTDLSTIRMKHAVDAMGGSTKVLEAIKKGELGKEAAAEMARGLALGADEATKKLIHDKLGPDAMPVGTIDLPKGPVQPHQVEGIARKVESVAKGIAKELGIPLEAVKIVGINQDSGEVTVLKTDKDDDTDGPVLPGPPAEAAYAAGPHPAGPSRWADGTQRGGAATEVHHMAESSMACGCTFRIEMPITKPIVVQLHPCRRDCPKIEMVERIIDDIEPLTLEVRGREGPDGGA
jgi:hypothetical protein